MAADGTLIFDTKIDTDGLKNFGKVAAAGLGAVTAAAGAAIGASVKLGMSFESSMSAVGATAMATTEDMEILSQCAKDMGANTVFSATQAADAMNYMAMAGWKTEEMVGGIEGIMNLAAASGEDLATTSDIVTDALTAFGMSASDSGRFADVLAAASSNANTNVGLMGETFKYVAPVAGSLGYSCEDTAVAIGLMANAGIKGGQAGTALRSTLTRLAKPTKESAEAMETLGLSLTDSNGEMKSFNQLMVDMRKGFKNLTKDEKAATAAALGGQEAMSGLLAIANASEADFNKLTDAINSSSGAAEEMADRKLDNLQGKMTLLGSAAESLALAVYEHMEQPLKEAAEAAIDSVNKITQSINSGEMKGALSSLGSSLGSLVSTLVNLAAAVLPPVISALAFVGEHFETIATVIIPVVAAVKSYTLAVKAYEAATKLAAIAQNLFNTAMSLNPAAAAIAGIVALTTFTLALTKTVNKETEAEKEAREEREKYKEAVEEETKAIKEAEAARKEKIAAASEETATAKILADELRSLADETGKVHDKDKARAAFILDELNDALGTEYTMTGNQINRYEELCSSIDNVILSKRALAFSDAIESDYTTAKNNYIDTLNRQAELEAEVAAATQNVTLAQQDLNAAQEEYAELSSSGLYDPIGDSSLLENIDQLRVKLDDANSALETTTQDYSNCTAELNSYIDVIDAYEGVTEAMVNEDYPAMELAMSKYNDGFVTAEDTVKRSASEQAAAMTESALSIITSLNNLSRSGEDTSKKFIANTESMAEAQLQEFSKLGVEIPASITNALSAAGYVFDAESGKLVTKFKEFGMMAAEAPTDELTSGILNRETDIYEAAKKLGNAVPSGYENGISENSAAPAKASVDMTDASLNAIAETQNSNSPSKVTYEFGMYFAEGFANGISAGKSIAVNAAISLATAAIKAAKNTAEIKSPSRVMRDEVGKMLVLGLAQGIDENAGAAVKSMEDLSEDMLESQQKYLKTKSDMEIEQAAYDEAKRVRQYEESLANAKTAAEKQKLIAEEERRLKEKQDEEDLKKLQEAAERDKEELKRLQNYADEKKQIFEDLRDDVIATYEDIADYMTDSLDPVMDKLDSMKDKLRSFGDEAVKTWSTSFTEGDKTETYYHLGNFDQRISQLTEYSEALKSVKQRLTGTFGTDTARDFFEILADMDVAEGIQFAQLLASADDNEFQKYISDWKTARDLGEAISKELYADEYHDAYKDAAEYMRTELEKLGLEVPESLFSDEDIGKDFVEKMEGPLNETTEYIRTELEKLGLEIPDGFFDSGTLSAEQFRQGFFEELEGVFADAREMINKFNASLSLDVASGESNTTTNYYNSSYTISGTSSTVRESVQAMEAQAAIERMRGY